MKRLKTNTKTLLQCQWQFCCTSEFLPFLLQYLVLGAVVFRTQTKIHDQMTIINWLNLSSTRSKQTFSFSPFLNVNFFADKVLQTHHEVWKIYSCRILFNACFSSSTKKLSRDFTILFNFLLELLAI